MSTSFYWYGKGKSNVLVVHFSGRSTKTMCADTAALVYDNGNTYAWLNGKMMFAA